MQANSYQQQAQQYAVFPLEDSGWDYLLSALSEENGEFQAIFAKNARKGHGRKLTPEQREHAINELGDLCWMIALSATLLDEPLAAVMSRNINKLEERRRHNVIEGSGESVADRK